MAQEGGVTDRETLDRDLEILHDVQPYTKDSQLKLGRPRRYRRKVAGPKQWAAIREAKCYTGYCRICSHPVLTCEAHHLVPRSRGGDDVSDNIVGLCRDCHRNVTENSVKHLVVLAALLTDAEYAYIIGKLGEAGLERLFGVNR